MKSNFLIIIFLINTIFLIILIAQTVKETLILDLMKDPILKRILRVR